MGELTPKVTLREAARGIGRILVGRPNMPPTLAGNELLGIVLDRRSTRRFASRAIGDDVFDAIMEAGRVAPSTVNLQSWTFMTFTAASWREKFGSPIPFKAPRAVIVCGDTHRYREALDTFPRSPLVEYTLSVVNASLAAMNMTVAAEALGVTSVMLSETGRSGLLDIGYLAERLELPDGVFPLMTIAFGYPDSSPPPMPPKLPMEAVAFADGVYHQADAEVLADWLSQMIAGYKASHPFSSFDSQLRVYESKIGQAEKELAEMVFARVDTRSDMSATSVNERPDSSNRPRPDEPRPTSAPCITTERLTLSALAPADAEALFAYRSLSEVACYQTWEPTSVGDATDFLERVSGVDFDTPGTWAQLGVRLRESGDLIGDLGAHFLEDGEQVEIGLTLAPEYQGRGLGAEAAGGLLGYLFEDLGKHRVFASVDPRNAPSIKLLRRLGMRQEAHLIQSLRFKSEWADDVVFAMLKSEWDELG